MLQRSGRRAEKEAEWRGHVLRQAASGESIRGYCRRRGVSEASFYVWRRELAKRDRSARRTAGAEAGGSAGLVAVHVVDDTTARCVSPSVGDDTTAHSAGGQTLEIECPGGAVLRLREEISADVLERVLRVCLRMQVEFVSDRGAAPATAGVPVRSC